MYWNQSETNIWVAGHRGNPVESPENTMASFRNAMHNNQFPIPGHLNIQFKCPGMGNWLLCIILP